MSGVACDAIAHRGSEFSRIPLRVRVAELKVRIGSASMNLRLKRTASIAAVSLVALAAYHVAAVPLIEPTFADSSSDTSSAPPFVDQPSKKLDRAIYAPGSWELDNPTCSKATDQSCYSRSIAILPTARVKLFPCAICVLS